MKISKKTIEVLKNFATINSNILIRQGNVLSTISTGKNIFARAEVDNEFEKEFAVYDLNGLLGLLTAFDNADVDFGDESLTVKQNNSTFEYFYADPNIIVSAPDKTIEVDEFFKFKLTKDKLELILKAAGITAAPMFSVVSKDGKVTIQVGDPSTPKSNSFVEAIGEASVDFNAQLAIENLKVVPGDYEVVVSQKKFLHFKNEGGLQYWLALERSSEI
jgi:hypothetical protein